MSALPVCERDFQISLREGVGLPRLADKQTMANSVGGKSLCTRLEFQGVTVCIEPINKICKKINSIQQFVERRLQFLRSNPG